MTYYRHSNGSAFDEGVVMSVRRVEPKDPDVVYRQRSNGYCNGTGGGTADQSYLNMVTLVIVDLGWVNYDFGHSIVCQVLLGQTGIWQNRLGNWARWWNIQIKVNPTLIREHQSYQLTCNMAVKIVCSCELLCFQNLSRSFDSWKLCRHGINPKTTS